MSWALFGGVLGGFGGLSGGSWAVLVALGAILGDIWGSWAASGATLEASWAVLGASWRPPGRLGGALACKLRLRWTKLAAKGGQDWPKMGLDRAKMANMSVIFGFLGVQARNHEKPRKTKEFLGNP